MLKRYLKSSIIVLIQFVLLAIVLIIAASWLFNNPAMFKQWQHFFARFQWAFLLYHAMFYLGVYMLWPRLVSLAIHRQVQRPTSFQIAKAHKMRLYLIGVFVVLELLMLSR